MTTTNKTLTEKPRLVTKVSLIDTFRAITPGVSVTYDCRTAGLYSTAHSCVSRLNQAAGRKEYTIGTADNGMTYTVTRHKPTL